MCDIRYFLHNTNAAHYFCQFTVSTCICHSYWWISDIVAAASSSEVMWLTISTCSKTASAKSHMYTELPGINRCNQIYHNVLASPWKATAVPNIFCWGLLGNWWRQLGSYSVILKVPAIEALVSNRWPLLIWFCHCEDVMLWQPLHCRARYSTYSVGEIVISNTSDNLQFDLPKQFYVPTNLFKSQSWNMTRLLLIEIFFGYILTACISCLWISV